MNDAGAFDKNHNSDTSQTLPSPEKKKLRERIR